jgi:protein TonB
MPRDLFGDVTHPSISVGNRKWYTVPLSLAAHVSVIVSIVLVSLVAQEFVPLPREVIMFTEPVLPDPPPPPKKITVDKVPPANRDAAPTQAPTGITPDDGIDRTAQYQDPGSGIEVGVIPGGEFPIVGEGPVAPPPPPKPRETVRVGGGIRPPAKIRDAAPVYPAIAQAARVEGTVILEALLDERGRVQNLKVLRSYPLLDQAAIDAVRQWEYTPTLLNGVPVSVIMTVTVTFKLTR